MQLNTAGILGIRNEILKPSEPRKTSVFCSLQHQRFWQNIRSQHQADWTLILKVFRRNKIILWSSVIRKEGCGCRGFFKSNCPLVVPGTVGDMPSVGVFLRDSNPYLREFRRKPRKTPSDWVDKRDRESKPAPPIYQFWALNRSATGRVGKGVRLWLLNDYCTKSSIWRCYKLKKTARHDTLGLFVGQSRDITFPRSNQGQCYLIFNVLMVIKLTKWSITRRF